MILLFWRVFSVGENNKKTTFLLPFLAAEKIQTGWLYEEIYLAWREKNVPPEFTLTDYMKLFIPPRREKSKFWRAFQNLHKQIWLKKNIVENVAICNKLLVSLKVQQMGLTLSLIMNQKKLIDILLCLSLKKRSYFI